jgi:hypothetical protein
MKTIAQQLNIKEFPFKIEDKDGNEIYFETLVKSWKRNGYDSEGFPNYVEHSDRYWKKSQYDSNGDLIYTETSKGYILDKRPKSCEGKVVEIDGKKYELKEVK